MHQEILPIEDAAKRSGITRRTLDRWIEAGDLEAFHKDNDPKTYVDLQDVQRRKDGFVRGRKQRDNG